MYILIDKTGYEKFYSFHESIQDAIDYLGEYEDVNDFELYEIAREVKLKRTVTIEEVDDENDT